MISLQPTLENDLVLLRPLRVDDFQNLYNAANDPKIWELHQNPDRWKQDVFRDFFRGAMDSNGAFVIIDKATKAIIGSSRFRRHESDGHAVEIGWTFLSRDFWGGTYNQSFKSLMIDYAFKYFDHVLFNVDQNNFRSQKAVKKLGGELIDKNGKFGHLHTTKSTGLTFIISKNSLA